MADSGQGRSLTMYYIQRNPNFDYGAPFIAHNWDRAITWCFVNSPSRIK